MGLLWVTMVHFAGFSALLGGFFGISGAALGDLCSHFGVLGTTLDRFELLGATSGLPGGSLGAIVGLIGGCLGHWGGCGSLCVSLRPVRAPVGSPAQGPEG